MVLGVLVLLQHDVINIQHTLCKKESNWLFCAVKIFVCDVSAMSPEGTLMNTFAGKRTLGRVF